MDKIRKYNERILIPSSRKVIIPTDEVLFHEIQAAIDYKKECQCQKDADTSENLLNRNYLIYAEQFEGILEDDVFLVKLYNLAHLKSRMELIRRCKEDKISISVFSDKYGNKYLKAKAAFPEYSFVDGKKRTKYKSLSIHLGRLEEFKDGVMDKKAIATAREKLLHKAKMMMDVIKARNENSKENIE
jgi:hypothetical protein